MPAKELSAPRRSPSLNSLPPEAVPGRILNSRQAAEYWGVSLPQWRRLYWQKKVPAPILIGVRKCGWRLSDLVAALEEKVACAAPQGDASSR
jgi:predicted DNA-binding transcriptional regulator AlpA